MINCRYCLANVLDDSHERALFIKADGKALYFPHNMPISWDDFENATGITLITRDHNHGAIYATTNPTGLVENEDSKAICNACTATKGVK